MKYDTPPQSVLDLINKVIEDNHPDLLNNDVTVDALFALTEDAPLKDGGYSTMSVTKINNLKLRVKGMKDAEIVLDKTVWESINEKAQIALLDHALTKLEVKKDKEGETKIDDCGRPCLKIRKYDYRLGLFRDVAIRNGEYSPEQIAARILWRESNDVFFPNVP